MNPLDAFGDGAALLTGIGLVLLIMWAWRIARFVEREQGSVREWQAQTRALARVVGHG